MWISYFKCQECGYHSDSFLDGYSIHRQEWTVIFIARNKSYRVERIPVRKLIESGVDLDQWTGLDEFLDSRALPDEHVLKLPWGEDVDVSIKCEICGHVGMKRTVSGME